MQIIEKRLRDLHQYEKNPRNNDGAVDYVAESIRSYGFKVPIVIDKNGVIVAGHTRCKAAEKIGMETVPCIVADDLTDEQVRAFRIADNKVSDFSIWDNKLLLEELDEIGDDLFTRFEDGDIFNTVLNEADNSVIEDNDYGVIFEAVFKSEDEGKIQKIKEAWEKISGEDSDS